jgi:hypothetical protein
MTAKETIRPYRKNAVIAGILFIIATVFLFIGESVYAPILTTPGYLETAYPARITAIVGMLLEFACVLSIPLIPVFLFPVLKKHSETLALGYIVFRLFEALLFVLGEINELMFISLSQEYLSGQGADAAYLRNTGSSIQAWNDWTFSFYIFIFAIGAMMLYAVLYRSRLIPRFISGWGFISAVLIFTSVLLDMLELNLNFPGMAFELIFVVPIAVQEMVMALWFIIKGFNPSAVAVESKEIKISRSGRLADSNLIEQV